MRQAHNSDKKALAKKAAKIFEILKSRNPDPKIELDYINDFTLLVAIVMSAQTTDKKVNKVTPALFEKVTTPEEMIDLGYDALVEMIKTIGIFRNKAKNVIALSKKLLAEFNGVVPHNREALESLPGVGRKTANVFLNVATGAKLIGVDTHVFRLSHRIGFSEGKTPLDVERDLDAVIPDEFKDHASMWLVLHGRYICVARRPLCEQCPIRDYCDYYQTLLGVRK